MQGSNDEGVVSLVVDASGLRQGSAEAVALGKRIIDSFKAIEAAANQVSGGVATSGAGIVKSLGDTNRFLGQIERSLNPLAASANKAQIEMNRLIGIMGGSNVEAANRASKALELQAKKVLELKNAIQLASEENKRLEAVYMGLEKSFQNAIGSLGNLVAKYQPATASAKQMTSELASLNAAYKAELITETNYIALQSKIISSYNEGTIAAQKLAEVRARMISQARQEQNTTNSQENFNRILGVNPKSGVGTAAQSASVFQRNFDQEEAELENLRRTTEKTNKATKEAADRVDYLTTRFNQDVTAAKNYRQTIRELNEAFDKGVISHRELGIETSRAIDVYNRSTVEGEKASKKFSTSIHEIGLNSRVAQYAMTNFSFQINDVISGVFMGQQPFRIFAQQAGQFVQIFQQIGREHIGTFFKDMGKSIVDFGGNIGRWLITPLGLAVTSITALSTAFAVGITRAISIENQIRTLGVTLKTLGTNSLATAEDIVNMIPGLQRTGLSRSESRDILQGVVRNRAINPQAAELIGRVGANFAATFGGTAEEAAKTFADSLADGVEKATEFALRIDAISGSEASNMRVMAEHGRSMEVLNQIADRVDKKLKDNLLNTMTPLGRAILNVRNSWDEMIIAFSKTGGITTAVNALSDLLKAAKNLAEGNRTEGSNALKGAVLGGITGGTLGLAGAGIGVIPGTIGGALVGAGMGALTFPTSPPPPSSGSGSAASAVDSMLQFSGLTGADPKVKEFIKSNLGIDPSFGAWCAQFVNAALKQQGIEGTGSSLASSFRTFGTPITPGQIQKGDIFVAPPSMGATGHVGLTTGNVRQEGNKILVEIISSNTWDPNSGLTARAGTRWREVTGDVALRRAPGQVAGEITSAGVINPNNQIQTATKFIEDQKVELMKLLDVQKQSGLMQELVIAKQQTETIAREKNLDPIQKQVVENQLLQSVLDKYAATLGITHRAQEFATEGIMKTADAFQTSTEAGIKAKAEAEARNIVLQRTGTLIGQETEIEKEAALIVNRLTAESLQAATERTAALTPEIQAHKRLSEAYGISAAAGREQEIRNQAIANVQEVLNNLNIKDSNIRKEVAERLVRENENRLKIIDSLKAETELKKLNIQSGNEIQSLNLQIDLQGKTTAEIQKQIALLTEKQRLDALGNSITKEEYDRRLLMVGAVEDMKIALDEAVKAQQRLEEGIRNIANTIESTLTQSITDAFSGKKVDDWGTKIKTMLGSISSSIASSLFIKPLIGEVLGGFGLTNLASSFGSFGSGGLFGGSSGTSGSVTLTPNGSGGFTLSNISSGTSLVKDLFGSSSGSSGLFSGVNDFFSGGLGGLFAHTPTASDFAAGVGPVLKVPGSLFGDLTLGSAASSIGAGFGAGSLLNSLLGGNTLLGSIGSGVGSLAGTLLPSALGFSLGPFGGILGGALGGLFGLFGNNKPSNFSSGSGFDLATGRMDPFQSSGNKTNDKTARDILDAVSDFTRDIVSISGGTATGSFYAQAGTRDGIKIKGTVGGFSGKFKAADTQEAIDIAELTIARNLEGVSDNFKIVMNKLTDASDIINAAKFVGVYDDLKSAADSAFTSISSDTKKIGIFSQALNDINDIFDGLTDDAIKYGLSLDPINAGLKEALKRLKEDADNFVKDLILGITDPNKQAVEELKRTNKALLDDVVAVGGNAVEVQRYNTLALEDLWKSQTKTLSDLQDELKFGSSSGLTGSKQVEAANDNFKKILTLVEAGNTSKIEDLAAAGADLISLSQTTFGNAPKTASLRKDLLENIDEILSNRGFASGTTSTPPGYILVGENGPEWMQQGGGNKIIPNGVEIFSSTIGNSNKELIQELKDLKELLRINNNLVQGVGTETIGKLEKIANKSDKRILEETKRTKVA